MSPPEFSAFAANTIELKETTVPALARPNSLHLPENMLESWISEITLTNFNHVYNKNDF